MTHLADASPSPLVPNATESIIGLIAFLIVFGVLAKILLPRIQKTLEERTEKIEGGLKRAEELQNAANAELEKYRAQLEEARHDASRLREEAKQQGVQIVAEMRQRGQAEYDRLLAAAEAQIEAQKQQALTSLRAEVGTLSVDLASRVVGESLEDEARQRGTVDRFLAQLEQESASAAERETAR